MKQKEFQAGVIVILGLIAIEILFGFFYIILAIVCINKWLKIIISIITAIYFFIKIKKIQKYYEKLK